ncbi:MAG TPA: hypothetical protein VMV86_03360 [Methanosarcinales archaeon]|nr:hypothetical protein [Methanosarcinales archaeon]
MKAFSKKVEGKYEIHHIRARPNRSNTILPIPYRQSMGRTAEKA